MVAHSFRVQEEMLCGKLLAILKKYTERTSICGFRYLTQDGRTCIERLFWLVVLAGCFFANYRLTKSSYYAYQNHPVNFVTDTDYLHWNTSFPQIVVCETESSRVPTSLEFVEKHYPEYYKDDMEFALLVHSFVFEPVCNKCSFNCDDNNNPICDINFNFKELSRKVFLLGPDESANFNAASTSCFTILRSSLCRMIFTVKEMKNDDALIYEDFERRKCKFPHETESKRFNRYSQTACIVDCRAHHQLRIFWLLVLAGCFFCNYQLTKSSYYAYQHHSVSFVTETDYLHWNTSYPQIVVCEIESASKAPISKEFVIKNFPKYKADWKLAQLIHSAVFQALCIECSHYCNDKNKPTCDVNFNFKELGRKVKEIKNDEALIYEDFEKRKCKFPHETELKRFDRYTESTMCNVYGLKCLGDHNLLLRGFRLKGAAYRAWIECDCPPSCVEPEYNVVYKECSKKRIPLISLAILKKCNYLVLKGYLSEII
ncbi:Pickpocket 13 [Gryllus bimaculatus]|nr:Pickpocket 13 [Gryllus bimaculatus]